MNKEMNETVTRETLVKAAEACEAALAPVLKSVKIAERAILERAVAGCGEVEIYVNSHEGFEIAIPDEKNYRWYRVELSYQKVGWREANPRRLKMSVAGYGSFGADETSMVRLMTVVGRLAERLSEIEKELGQVDWATFDSLRLASYRANDEVGRFDIEAKEAAKEAAKAEAAKRLAAGVVIQTGIGRPYSSKHIRVEKVTAKLVYWNAVDRAGNLEYGTYQSKKDEVLAKLASGAWKVVDDVKFVAA